MCLIKYEGVGKHSEETSKKQSGNFTAIQLKKVLYTGCKDTYQWHPRQEIFRLQQQLNTRQSDLLFLTFHQEKPFPSGPTVRFLYQ